MDDISDIKELVVQALTRKKVLSRLRAELRSNVFVTIDEEETSSGGDGLGKKTNTAARESFLQTEQGQLLADLVHEFLQWNNMEFTLRVYEPEIGLGAEHRTRSELMRQLDVSGPAPQGPLLLALLQGQHGSAGQPARTAMQQPKPDTSASTRPPLITPTRTKAAEPEPEGSLVEGEDSYALEVESDEDLLKEVEEDDDEDASPVGLPARSAVRRMESETKRGALFGPMSDELPSPLNSPYSPDAEGREEFNKPRATLSPLAPIGGRSPLAPLAPLGGAKGLTPLAGGKKAPNDIKDELRRAGLLTLPTDSFSVSESSLDIPLHAEDPAGLGGNRPSPSRLSVQSLPEPVPSRMRLQDLNTSDVGQSLELRDFGIVPSDRPGDLDLDDADYAETAEWG